LQRGDDGVVVIVVDRDDLHAFGEVWFAPAVGSCQSSDGVVACLEEFLGESAADAASSLVNMDVEGKSKV